MDKALFERLTKSMTQMNEIVEGGPAFTHLLY